MKVPVPHLDINRLIHPGLDFHFDPGRVLPIDNINIEDYFQLDSFSLSKSDVEPFEAVKISWEISAKGENIDLNDFAFTLFGPDESVLKNIALNGSTTVFPRHSSTVNIKGRRKGRLSPLGDPLMLRVDQSECDTVEIPKEWFDAAMNEAIGQIARSESELSLRGNDPLVSEWTQGKFSYDIPLKLVISKAPDIKIDLTLDVSFSLVHNQTSSDLEVSITDYVDADFSTFADFASFGATKIAEKKIEKMVLLILDSRLEQFERAVLEFILRIPTIKQGLDEGKRLLIVEPIRLVNFEYLKVVLCSVPKVFQDHILIEIKNTGKLKNTVNPNS